MLGTKEEVLTLSAEDSQNLHWHVVSALGMHLDMKNHAGGTSSMFFGSMSSRSTKKGEFKKFEETKSIVIDNKISKFIWSKMIAEAQGFKFHLNVVLQCDTSTVKLAENGKLSSGKRALHFDIPMFRVKDSISRK